MSGKFPTKILTYKTFLLRCQSSTYLFESKTSSVKRNATLTEIKHLSALEQAMGRGASRLYSRFTHSPCCRLDPSFSYSAIIRYLWDSGVASSRLLVVHRWCNSFSRWYAGMSHSTLSIVKLFRQT